MPISSRNDCSSKKVLGENRKMTRDEGNEANSRQIKMIEDSVYALDKVGILKIAGYDPKSLIESMPPPIESWTNARMLIIPPENNKAFHEMGKKFGVSVCRGAWRRWREPGNIRSIKPYWVSVPSFHTYNITLGSLVGFGRKPLCGMEGIFLAFAIRAGSVMIPHNARAIDLPASGSHGEVISLKILPQTRRGVEDLSFELAMRKPNTREGNFFALGLIGKEVNRKHLTAGLLTMR